jgi:hypothetical protein
VKHGREILDSRFWLLDYEWFGVREKVLVPIQNSMS